jgi:hypothetical protein
MTQAITGTLPAACVKFARRPCAVCATTNLLALYFRILFSTTDLADNLLHGAVAECLGLIDDALALNEEIAACPSSNDCGQSFQSVKTVQKVPLKFGCAMI